jgi:hypothetical protein
MAKNIVICSDGTGNTAIQGRGTNVFKLFEAIDLNGHRTDPQLLPQIALYDDGVGTERFKPLKIFAGMTGFGLSRNVKQLYKELVRVYDPGDRIFLFGFSRGAFTVRTLAGLITTCGIVDTAKLDTARALESAVREAYTKYRQCYRTVAAQWLLGQPDSAEIRQFKATRCLQYNVPIAFIGVWDTVDAVGLPFHMSDAINLMIYRFKFPNRRLSDSVERACHALALDDARHSFHPLLWDESAGTDERIEQVWFAGAHSNVGGGYPKQGMSLVTLEWMIRQAEKAGLRVLASDCTFYREHANVDDKLYDPRAGLGIFYRWKPRDITAMCHQNNVPPTIHLSVLERIAHGTEDYTPGNLPPHTRVVITPTGEPEKDAAAIERARAVESVLRASHVDGQPLLARVTAPIVLGRLAYYVYLLSCIMVVLAASAPEDTNVLLHPWSLVKNMALLTTNLLTLQLGAVFTRVTQMVTTPWLLGCLASGFLVSYALTLYADRCMSAVFSQFWYGVQPHLRHALKNARQTAAEARTHKGVVF